MTGPHALAGVSSIIVHDEEEPSNFESITKMELSLLCDHGISDPTEILRKRSREAAARHGLPIGPIPPRQGHLGGRLPSVAKWKNQAKKLSSFRSTPGKTQLGDSSERTLREASSQNNMNALMNSGPRVGTPTGTNRSTTPIGYRKDVIGRGSSRNSVVMAKTAASAGEKFKPVLSRRTSRNQNLAPGSGSTSDKMRN